MDAQTITNPFSQIDNRLKSIEATLAIIAAKEQAQTEKKYYTIAEAAEKLNVAEITLYRNAKSGNIPVKKIGSRLMVPGSYVDSPKSPK